MSDFTIYSDDAAKVQRLMSAYQASVKAEYIVLCHRDGSIIAEVGSLGIDATPLAVLSTASFDSARQVGMMLGGENFQARAAENKDLVDKGDKKMTVGGSLLGAGIILLGVGFVLTF